jgi:hypothetical protein
MNSCLLAFRRFAHDPQGRLTRILGGLSGPVGLAEMLRKGALHIRLVRGERMAADGASFQRNASGDEMRAALCHAPSLRRLRWRSTPVEIKRHHYQWF